VKPPWPSTSSPATAAEEGVGHHHEQKESRRTPALKRSRNSLPSRTWEVANGNHPSTGVVHQLLPLPDLSSPSTATVVKGERSQIRPATNHNIHEQTRIKAKKKASCKITWIRRSCIADPGLTPRTPRPHQRRLSRAPLWRRRGGEDLFRSDNAVFASSPSLRKTRRRGTSSWQTLASPSTNGRQNLDLGNLIPNLYTAARRFSSSSSSTTASRPLERKGASWIAADDANHPFFAWGNCSEGKEREACCKFNSESFFFEELKDTTEKRMPSWFLNS
jgi:hypothetical protein